jgi:hypothetical protein
VAADSTDPSVHAFCTWDEDYELYNLLFWNLAASPAKLQLEWSALPDDAVAKRGVLDPATGSSIENDRLRPQPPLRMARDSDRAATALGPYGIEFWYLERTGINPTALLPFLLRLIGTISARNTSLE